MGRALSGAPEGWAGWLLAPLLAALVWAAWVPCASAQWGADARARRHYAAGEAAYAAEQYDEAVTQFSEAYRLSPRPLLLFNLANAYERLERYHEAVEALEGYLPHAPIEEHADLQARIAVLRRLESGDTGGGGGSGLMIPGIIVAATGGALLITGVVFGALVLDGRGTIEGDCQRTGDGRLVCTDGASARIAEDETFSLIADIGMIGGGVIAAAGLTLIVLDLALDSSGGASRAAWVPSLGVGPDGGALSWQGSF